MKSSSFSCWLTKQPDKFLIYVSRLGGTRDEDIEFPHGLGPVKAQTRRTTRFKYDGEKRMAVTFKVTQQRSGGNHSAIFVEDNLSQREIGIAVWDPARSQFAFHPDNADIVLSAADSAAIVSALNSLAK